MSTITLSTLLATLLAQATTTGEAGPSTFVVRSIADRAAQAGSLWGTIGWIAVAVVGVVAFVSVLGMALILAERKVCGHFQCRLGPMRVGPHGIFQTLADTIKLAVKEDIVPDRADRFLHAVAPAIVLAGTFLALVVIPLGPFAQLADLNIGVIYLVAVLGLGVLGVLVGGWGSCNKWSLLGAMRAGAQMISYELSAVLAILVIVLFAGSLSLQDIVRSQADGWWIWRGHVVGLIAFTIFLIASTAELGRIPFDLPEGESEIGAGFHTEYSGLRFAFFFLAEFINMFVAAAILATLFLGGWMPFHIGGLDGFNAIMDLIPPAVWFWGKTTLMIFVYMWFRWTFPRLRVDQLMKLEWKFLLPIGFANLFLAAVVVLLELYFFPSP